MTQPSADIGLIGLGAMGRGLALNLADRGWAVAVFDHDEPRRAGFASEEGHGARFSVWLPLGGALGGDAANDGGEP